MSAFKLQNINTVNFVSSNGAGGVSMIQTTGGVSVDGYIVATGGVSAGTLQLNSGSITDTTGSITFGDENLSTTGGISAGAGMSAGNLLIGIGTSLNEITTKSGFPIRIHDTTSGVSIDGAIVQVQGLTFPAGITGSNGQVISTDGSGTLSFTNNGGGGATSINNLTDAAAGGGLGGNIFLGYKPTINFNAANNIAIGVSAIFHEDLGNVSCLNNIAVGSNALLQATAGSTNDNIAIGYSTLISTDAISSQNVAIGTSALTALTNGTSQNVAVGYIAGQEITSGYQNTIVGASAGITLTTGQNNSLIGFGAEPTSATISNEFTLGNSSIATLRCADTTIASLSDSRDKTDVEDSRFGIGFLNNVRPVEFTWQRRNLAPGDENNNKNGLRRVGFLAQELLEAMPDGENDILDLVYESNPDRLEAKYGNLIPILVKAVKDLKAEVDALKQRMDACSC